MTFELDAGEASSACSEGAHRLESGCQGPGEPIKAVTLLVVEVRP